MLPVSFLFENVSERLEAADQRKIYMKQKMASLPRAQSPTAERDSYIKQRVAALRRMIGKKGQNTKEINMQVQDYLKKRFTPGMGVTQY
ncbi:MAG TPA: hypothetical protein PKG96_09935 [Bacilli bacterium]|jgi:hypothetical protein|nr:hypothetical protein [Bacilli bacterium]HQM07664.1 hypothetical protein [Bacilli bacterium]